MKITCPFCGVSYSVRADAGRFQCAVCSHVWRADLRAQKSRRVKLLLSGFILLVAVFILVATILWFPNNHHDELTANVNSVSQMETSLNVSGVIKNISDNLYGIPDMFVIITDKSGVVINSYRFSPPAPLLDSGESINFSVDVPGSYTGAIKVMVKFKE
ncbi:MAG: hypothetical protein LBL75_00875 [Rickettsiales bacterium]|jgi:hypothetical protein|nr:hypothetical protein [Rickettsiales bacterium]